MNMELCSKAFGQQNCQLQFFKNIFYTTSKDTEIID